MKFRETMTSPAWKEAFENGLQDVLESAISFAPDKPKLVLKVLGLLWCSSSFSNKVKLMLKLINPPEES